ncbi:hypothetical protein C8R47DRAFT_1068432 [Mycena vitilis]|nr:hypothetical protein C8R47DRAFT_1068432 [Mycena vitilis]
MPGGSGASRIGAPPHRVPHCGVGQAQGNNYRAVGRKRRGRGSASLVRGVLDLAAGGDGNRGQGQGAGRPEAYDAGTPRQPKDYGCCETARQTGGNGGRGEITSKNIISSMDAPSTVNVALPPMPPDSWRPSACLGP